MQERSRNLDFDLKFEAASNELAIPHRHAYFQIQVGFDGMSQQAIGSAVRPFGRGYLSFVLPYRVHLIRHAPGSRYCIVNFSPRFLWPYAELDLFSLDEVPVLQHPELAPFLLQEHADFFLDALDFARVHAWLDELRSLDACRNPGTTVAMRGILLQILGLVCGRHQAKLQELCARTPAASTPVAALQRVLRYVRDNLDKPMTLGDAAAAAFLSPNYLAHVLKKQTNRTFTQLVTERRIELAKELLIGTRLQVREVARKCGFADEAYFNRRFRRAIGSTPGEFRVRHALPLVGA